MRSLVLISHKVFFKPNARNTLFSKVLNRGGKSILSCTLSISANDRQIFDNYRVQIRTKSTTATITPVDTVSSSESTNALPSFIESEGQHIDLTLFQYQICPFCNIVKALLDHSKQPYNLIEVNPLTKSELKPWSGNYRKVPIAKFHGIQVNGSEEIVKAILEQPSVIENLTNDQWSKSSSNNSSKMTLETFSNSENAKQWMEYARNDLASLLYPNICRTLGDSYDAFGYVNTVGNNEFSTMQKMGIRTIGSVAMYIAASKIKKKLNITDEVSALEESIKKWERDGLQNNLFASGCDVPDMGDIAVFGVIRSVEGLAAHDKMISRGGAIEDWYQRMGETLA
mmetsp:Transcript_19263/g.23701  ORF Transcript_19263/g.23701 Transcript_19263/m.23701 type:complete len:341 (-) Transcript_19263:46-1068(-)